MWSAALSMQQGSVCLQRGHRVIQLKPVGPRQDCRLKHLSPTHNFNVCSKEMYTEKDTLGRARPSDGVSVAFSQI